MDYKGTASRWSELPAANSDFQVASDGFLEYLASTGTETFEAPPIRYGLFAVRSVPSLATGLPGWTLGRRVTAAVRRTTQDTQCTAGVLVGM